MDLSVVKKDFLWFLYHHPFGRFLLRLLKSRWVSSLVGIFMNSRFSKFLIKPFVRKHQLNLEDYVCDSFSSYNDFFTRKMKEGKRKVDKNNGAFIAPCDGFLSVYPIKNGLVIPVKQSKYSIASLLRNEELALKYQDGICLVFRLCVHHYHRYCYLDDGVKGKNISIDGFLHTVRPVALETTSVFVENSREYTLMHTKNFGDVVQVEVGAMLVGKINNYHEEYTFKKGEEKGMFLFGGSTIIVLLEKDKVYFSEKYFKKTKEGREIPVLMGEKIADVKRN